MTKPPEKAITPPRAPRLSIDDAQAADIELAQRDIREGKIATDAEMDEVWRRFDA